MNEQELKAKLETLGYKWHSSQDDHISYYKEIRGTKYKPLNTSIRLCITVNTKARLIMHFMSYTPSLNSDENIQLINKAWEKAKVMLQKIKDEIKDTGWRMKKW